MFLETIYWYTVTSIELVGEHLANDYVYIYIYIYIVSDKRFKQHYPICISTLSIHNRHHCVLVS